jgi:uncharacterized Fe-S cluster protein YjdI
MKKNVFLLSSALHTKHGIYNTKERIDQTLETVNSVRKYVPDSIIMLVDNSNENIKNDTSIELRTLLNNVDYYFSNCDNADIKYIHQNVDNHDVAKNTMECIGFINALSFIKNDPQLMEIISNSNRIFKLSGRYQIHKNFNILNFNSENVKNKYVFKKRNASWIDPDHTGVTTQLQTRLWSFPPSLFDDTLTLFNAIVENMIITLNDGKYIDVEHSMSKFIPLDKLVEIDVIGVIGNIAPNGALVIE